MPSVRHGAIVTLVQLHSLKLWHARHGHRQPLEKHVWDLVLTLWLSGWVGAPTALLLHLGWAEATCFGVIFLPGSYVGLRRWLHRRRLLRCDWIVALR